MWRLVHTDRYGGRNNKISFKDLSSFVAKSVREVEHVMSVGAENRKVG